MSYNKAEKELFLAVREGDLAKVKELIEEGVNPNTEDEDGWTVLMQACWCGHLDIVKYLVEEKGADINARNDKGQTALDVARMSNFTEIVEYLKEQEK